MKIRRAVRRNIARRAGEFERFRRPVRDSDGWRTINTMRAMLASKKFKVRWPHRNEGVTGEV